MFPAVKTSEAAGCRRQRFDDDIGAFARESEKRRREADNGGALSPRRGEGPIPQITAKDHEGGGLVQIWQVKGGKFVRVTDWYSAYPDVMARHLEHAAAKS